MATYFFIHTAKGQKTRTARPLLLPRFDEIEITEIKFPYQYHQLN
jgi:hypothetical protein